MSYNSVSSIFPAHVQATEIDPTLANPHEDAERRAAQIASEMDAAFTARETETAAAALMVARTADSEFRDYDFDYTELDRQEMREKLQGLDDAFKILSPEDSRTIIAELSMHEHVRFSEILGFTATISDVLESRLAERTVTSNDSAQNRRIAGEQSDFDERATAALRAAERRGWSGQSRKANRIAQTQRSNRVQLPYVPKPDQDKPAPSVHATLRRQSPQYDPLKNEAAALKKITRPYRNASNPTQPIGRDGKLKSTPAHDRLAEVERKIAARKTPPTRSDQATPSEHTRHNQNHRQKPNQTHLPEKPLTSSPDQPDQYTGTAQPSIAPFSDHPLHRVL